MKTVLLTGFEPFGGDAVNPSMEIARCLNGTTIGKHSIVGAVLPCVFGKAAKRLKRLLQEHRPALVVCLGLAAGRSAITPERVAINIDDARIPDNAGQQPVDKPIRRQGPVAYWTKLPIKAIVRALRAEGFPAEISQTAGTFVCNHVFYGLMHELARRQPSARGGFIHIPGTPDMPGGLTGLPLEQTTAAIRLAIATCLRVRRDIRETGGKVS
jgi:pyroglutamyl-peptidase